MPLGLLVAGVAGVERLAGLDAADFGATLTLVIFTSGVAGIWR